MKKILFMLAFALTASVTAFAENADDCIIAVYENGVLYSCAAGTYENDAVFGEVKLPESGAAVKAFFTDKGTVDISVDMVNPSLAPEPTTQPTAEPSTTIAPTAVPEKTPRPTYHPAYESEKDAIEAIAVVDSVGIVSTDDDNKYEIKALYRGENFSFIVDNDIGISSSPQIFPEIAGENLLNLKKGDVIMVTCRISGGVKRIDLIMRPADKDIITSGADVGENFEQLFSFGGAIASRKDWKVLEYGKNPPSDGTCYAFGVIRERSNGTLVLVNKNGLDSEAHYLDLSDNVIVYTCDMENKPELSIGTQSSLIRSSIASKDKDDDDNIIAWNEDRTYNYALVRVVDGTVVEAVVYKGYEN